MTLTPSQSQIAAFHREVQLKLQLCAMIEAANADGRSVALPMSAQGRVVAQYIVDHRLPPVDLRPLTERDYDMLLSVVAAMHELRRELRRRFTELARDIVRLDNALTDDGDPVNLPEYDDGDA
jgi:hypothetical protein